MCRELHRNTGLAEGTPESAAAALGVGQTGPVEEGQVQILRPRARSTAVIVPIESPDLPSWNDAPARSRPA